MHIEAVFFYNKFSLASQASLLSLGFFYAPVFNLLIIIGFISKKLIAP